MRLLLIVLSSLFVFCKSPAPQKNVPLLNGAATNIPTQTTLLILGNVQDAGSPHTACKKDCCKALFLHPDPHRKVTSIGLIEPATQKKYLFEATPDVPTQLKNLYTHAPFQEKETPDGIFLTHAHIGHYTGLMYLGRESMNANKVPVYAMPKMKAFLETNGPWSQLVGLQNILLQPLQHRTAVVLSPTLRVIPFTVPHRDEYSETVGYRIEGPNKKALFIPDIDKWEKWDTDIIQAIAEVDFAFLDGTFYDNAELNGRNMAEIPHPFIAESMEKFKHLPPAEKSKIHFIHFNHTNPVLDPNSAASKTVLEKGFRVARMNGAFQL